MKTTNDTLTLPQAQTILKTRALRIYLEDAHPPRPQCDVPVDNLVGLFATHTHGIVSEHGMWRALVEAGFTCGTHTGRDGVKGLHTNANAWNLMVRRGHRKLQAAGKPVPPVVLDEVTGNLVPPSCLRQPRIDHPVVRTHGGDPLGAAV